MPLEIRKSKTHNSWCIVLSVAALAFFLYSTFSHTTTVAAPEKGLFWLPVLVLSFTTICFVADYLDTAPLLVLNKK